MRFTIIAKLVIGIIPLLLCGRYVFLGYIRQRFLHSPRFPGWIFYFRRFFFLLGQTHQCSKTEQKTAESKFLLPVI
jgi:hypothetical protein